MNSEKILTIFPHPDDETFGKGGALALHVKKGATVTVLCGTLGQMGRNMGKPFFATRESMPSIREKELRDACDALGVTKLYLLGLRDKMVEFEDPEYVAKLILEVINEVRPTLIYTYYPPYGVHPDHDAMSIATIIAVQRLSKSEQPTIYASPITNDRLEVLGPPDIELDVTEVLDKKLAAYRAHRSQSEAMIARMEAKIAANPELRQEIEAPLKKEQYWIYPV
jgi:N-acetylglucosamine malate deacetylase 2